MKKKILLLGFTCLSFCSFGQISFPGKSFGAIRVGTSVPAGNFGNKNFYNPAAGFASTGLHLAAEYGGSVNKYFGLGAIFGLRRNDFDDAAFNRNGTYRLYAHSGWRTNYALGNLIGQLPIGSHFLLFAKAGAGFTFNTYPQLSNKAGGLSTNPGLIEPRIIREGFAYGLGSGFMFHGERIGVGFDGYYLVTKPTFYHLSARHKLEMNTVNYSFNLCFKLNKS